MKNFQFESQQKSILKSSKIEDDITIISVESQSYSIDDSVALTFINNNRGGESTFDLYTITFEKGGKMGFSIVSPDERLNNVYAYTENGSISDTTYNIGLSITLERMPLVANQLLKYYYERKEENITRTYSYYNVESLIFTKWHQWDPFNRFSPDIGCLSLPPAGCSAIALSQAIAYLNLTNFSNGGYYDFAAMTAYTVPPSNSILESRAAQFVRLIGFTLNASYGCNGTGAFVADIIPTLKSYGYKYDSKKANIDYNWTASMIANYGTPLITSSPFLK